MYHHARFITQKIPSFCRLADWSTGAVQLLFYFYVHQKCVDYNTYLYGEKWLMNDQTELTFWFEMSFSEATLKLCSGYFLILFISHTHLIILCVLWASFSYMHWYHPVSKSKQTIIEWQIDSWCLVFGVCFKCLVWVYIMCNHNHVSSYIIA